MSDFAKFAAALTAPDLPRPETLIDAGGRPATTRYDIYRNNVTVGLTDAMARVFADTGPAQALLGLSLGVLDAVSPARLLLAELMMFGRR